MSDVFEAAEISADPGTLSRALIENIDWQEIVLEPGDVPPEGVIVPTHEGILAVPFTLIRLKCYKLLGGKICVDVKTLPGSVPRGADCTLDISAILPVKPAQA